jgi:hypothetical protein
VAGTISNDDAKGPALSLFALGQTDASLSFIRFLPDSVRDGVETIVAFRLLSKLWAQYKIDCGISQGRTLLSADNGYEVRVFTALLNDVCEWAPLRAANGVVRSHSPALSAYERRLYESEYDERHPLLLEIFDEIERLPPEMDPVRRAALLIERCQKFDHESDYGICWALNLAGSFGMKPLGNTMAIAPFPALFRRELLRFDRSKSWRDDALQKALAESAHSVSAAIFASFRDRTAFDDEFPDLRRNSRLLLAYSYLSGIGELTPTLLARLVGCSEPGARKMLRQLGAAGFASYHPPSPGFERANRFRLGWPGATWLRTFSLSDGPPPMDQFDD